MKTALSGLFDAARAFRFSLVGIAATASYLVLVNLVAAPVGPFTPFAAHVVGFAGSVGVSYWGHHAFTYRRSRQHGFYFTRFAVITAVLFAVTSALAFACDRYLRFSAALISVLVAVLYPACSYLLHSLWTFEERRRASAG